MTICYLSTKEITINEQIGILIHYIHKVIHNFHNNDVDKLRGEIVYLSVFSENIHNINISVDKSVCKSERRLSSYAGRIIWHDYEVFLHDFMLNSHDSQSGL